MIPSLARGTIPRFGYRVFHSGELSQFTRFLKRLATRSVSYYHLRIVNPEILLHTTLKDFRCHCHWTQKAIPCQWTSSFTYPIFPGKKTNSLVLHPPIESSTGYDFKISSVTQKFPPKGAHGTLLLELLQAAFFKCNQWTRETEVLFGAQSAKATRRMYA